MRPRDCATCVYCVLRSPGPPETAGAPAGLPGAGPARALALGEELWAIVADAPLPEYAAESIEPRLSDLSWVSACAVAHEAVVEHFGGLAPVLPMKLFTLFAGDERAAADLAGRRAEIRRVLDRVAGHLEWGVRIRFDAVRARQRAAGDGGATRPSSGTDFLRRKQQEKDGARALAGGAAQAAERVFEALARRAREARRRDLSDTPADSGLLLDAAFLVPSGEAEDFERAVGEEARRLAERACEVTLTGPWPPYNFVQEAP